MTLTNPKPAGWAFGEILTSAQMNALTVQIPYAADLHAGGTYAPSSALVIGGSGLDVTTVFACSGTAAFSGTNVFNSDATFNDNIFSTNINNSGTAALGAASAATISTVGLATTGTTTFGVPPSFSLGYKRRWAVAPNANSTFSVATSDAVIIRSQSAFHTNQIANATVDGTLFFIANLDSTYNAQINNASAVSLILLNIGYSALFMWSVVDSNWLLVAHYPNT